MIVNGTTYHDETPLDLVELLEKLRQTKQRCTFEFERSWTSSGTLGRSTGESKIPLILYNIRSMGGSALSDHLITKIVASKGKKLLWKKPDAKQEETPTRGVLLRDGRYVMDVDATATLIAGTTDFETLKKITQVLKGLSPQERDALRDGTGPDGLSTVYDPYSGRLLALGVVLSYSDSRVSPDKIQDMGKLHRDAYAGISATLTWLHDHGISGSVDVCLLAYCS